MCKTRPIPPTTLFFIVLSLLWMVSVSCCARSDAQTFHQIQITNNADDGYYNSYNNTGWHSSSEYGGANLVGSWGGIAWVSGYRFPATGINSGDTIQSAYLRFVSSDNYATSVTCGDAPCPNSTTTFRVYGVAQDDGQAFSGTAGNTPLDVPYTTAYTDYTTTGPGDVHGSCNGNNNGQNTCTHIIDVTNIVKEVTSRPGWTNASAIRFVLRNTNPSGPNVYAGFEDFSANAAKAAMLTVNPSLPTVVSSGAWGTSAQVTYPTSYRVGPFVYPGASTLLFFLGDYYNFYGQSISQPTVTDSCGNNWKALAGPTDWVGYAYDMRSTVYYVQNPAPCSAGDTIAVNVPIEEPIFVHFVAVAGSDITQAPAASDINSPNPATYTTSATTDPVVLGSNGLLVSWIFGDNDSAHTFTPQAGFATDVNSTPNYLTTTFGNVASPGSYQDQYSISPADGWQAVIVGLAASGGSTTPPAVPVITSSSSANGTAGTAFSYQIAATNSPTSYGATGLPSGLSVNTSTGSISGTPTATGTSTVTLSASNTGGTGTATLTLTIAPAAAPVITSGSSAGGTVGLGFSYQIAATNSPNSYGATGLPSGLSVNTSTGLISGTPTAAGGWTATLSATNASGTGTGSVVITIAVGSPVITSGSSASGTVGAAFSYQIAATNSPSSYGATGLPAGLSVNTSTGLISGSPTSAGKSTVTLSATNGAGTGTATLTLTISVAAPVITSATSVSGTVGAAFSYQIAATNSPSSYGATGLPSGLSVNASTGAITGTPTAAGTFAVTLKATNAGGMGTATLRITISGVVTHSIAFVQEAAKATLTRAKSLAVSFPTKTRGGDLIFMAFDFGSGVTPSSISDSQGNTFTEVGTQLTTPGGSASRVYSAMNIKGGSDTVTITLSANSAIEAYLTEYSGVDPMSPIEAQSGASGRAGAVSSGTANTSTAGAAIFGFCNADSACTVGAGFAARSTFHNNVVEDAMTSSPGSYAATATANRGWSMQMVVLKPAQ